MRRYSIEVNGTSYQIDVDELAPQRYVVILDGRSYEVRLTGEQQLAENPITPEILPLYTGDTSTPQIELAAPVQRLPAAAPAVAPAPTILQARPGASTVTAPMPGRVLSINASIGAQVSRGDVLLILEAMKMKNAIRAPADGVVGEILVQSGQNVMHGQVLLRLAEAGA